MKQKILKELDSRITRLQEHRNDEIVPGNEYGELNQALSKVLNATLATELTDIKDYIETL